MTVSWSPAPTRNAGMEMPVRIPVGAMSLEGDLTLPKRARGLVIFAHGSGSSRFSKRNRYVAGVLQERSVGTLLIDLLTAEEEAVDNETHRIRFDIPLLAARLESFGAWVTTHPKLSHLKLGYFGASTGAAAALIAAAHQPREVAAVVSRGGRPDLAMGFLPQIQAPTLLIVGERDPQVLTWNRQALERLNTQSRLEIIPRATHLFEEPGTLEEVAQLAAEWFERNF